MTVIGRRRLAGFGRMEKFDAFKERVRNAAAWLNGNAKKKEEMTGAVDSMQRRLQRHSN